MSKHSMSRWSKLVRDIMQEQGRSQHGLAKQAGVSRSVVRKMVSNASKDMRIRSLEQVLDTMGYELDAILKEPK